MDWVYNDKPVLDSEIPEAAIGFIYLITHIDSGKMYIGKKNLYSHKYSVRTVTVKSGVNKGSKVKKKTKIQIPSDWRDYYGSSDFLKEEIAKNGADRYRREIIRYCYSKSELSYYEIKEQLIRDVLLSDLYYNSWISCKIHKKHMKNSVL
jgi:hypothetical protein